MIRILHAFLLVFAFLLSQAGMSAHAINHVASISHLGDDKGQPSDSACELCVGYAQLAGSAPFPYQPPMAVGMASLQVPVEPPSCFPVRLFYHSRSRAPPVFS